jgi:hypothetical protein
MGSYSAGASIFLGKGDGTFQPPITVDSSLNPLSADIGRLVADFNGDGNIDLAGRGAGNTVTVVQGYGDGTFRTYASVDAGFGVGGFITADLRNKGVTDFVLFSAPGEAYTGYAIMLGNGDGSFQVPVRFGPGDPVGVAVGDFNNDGKLDLALGTADQLDILLGNGDGTFSSGTSYTSNAKAPQVGDFNGDGNEDVVLGNEIFVGNGDGTFGFPVTINASGIVGDLNGDGKSDLVTFSGNNIYAYLNMGNLTFQLVQTPIGITPTTLALADLNHDGKLDVAAGVVNGVLVLPGNGDGTFQSKGIFLTGATPNWLTTGDFNGDGILDVAGAGINNTIFVLQGNGDGTLQPSLNYDVGPVAGGTLAAADFNGDGKVDLATLSAGDVALLFNGTAAHSIKLGIPPGGSNSATVAPGGTATYTLSIGGGGMSGTALLTCTGTPMGATCTVPSSVNVSDAQASTFTVSVSTTASTAALQRRGSSSAWFLATLLIGMVWLPVGRRSRGLARGGTAILSLLLITFLVSCGGGSGGSGGGGGSNSGGTPAAPTM